MPQLLAPLQQRPWAWHSTSGSVPCMYGVQKPSLPGRAQLWQVPVQALLQHTESAHVSPNAHWGEDRHGCPCAMRQLPLEHTWPVPQGVLSMTLWSGGQLAMTPSQASARSQGPV